MIQTEFNIVGHTTRRKDGVARVTGQEQYTTDVSLPRMLHGRIVSSPYAHARIVRVDTSAAEAMGAVCLTFADVPKIRYNERIITVPWALHKDHYVLSDKVRRMGEAVAAVAAETEALAEQAARAVVVEYEPLPVITDPVAAMQPGAVALYDTVMLGDNEIPIKNNIACARDILEGDIEAAFAAADIVVEGEFRTPKIYHAQMEPKAVVCRPEANGGITVWATTQSIHNVRIVLGAIFGIPLSKVDIIRIPVGGTFGSSIQMNSPIPIGVALALKARRPVKLALTREEDMHDHTKYPAIIRLKIAAQNDGTLLGADQELIADIGAHIIQGYSYLGVTAGWLASLYKFKAVRHHGVAVYTNKAPSCAMQGFGNPQVTFAVESLMDELAEKLDIDPLELRLKNYVGLGESFWGQGPMVRSLVQSDGVQQLLREGAARIGWERRRASGGAGMQGRLGDTETRGRGDAGIGECEQAASTEYGIRNTEYASRITHHREASLWDAPRYLRGLGLGRGFHTSSAGAPQRSDVIDFSGAMVKINQDGSVDVITALMDHGGGTLEAAAKLVAETLCVP
jgi:xanthine dehydrogenase molybdenum-binding subunit